MGNLVVRLRRIYTVMIVVSSETIFRSNLPQLIRLIRVISFGIAEEIS